MLLIWDVYSGSRILIFIHPGSRFPDPDFYPSRIQQQKQKEEGGKIVVFPLLWPQILQLFYFEQVPPVPYRKNLSKLTKNNISFYPKKLTIDSQKYAKRKDFFHKIFENCAF